MNSPTDRADLRTRVEKVLADFLARQRTHLATVDPATAPVADALEAFVLGGGKRLRPAFAYWGYRGAGGRDNDRVITTVAALELVQASALIHDDVMDDSDMRRGEAAVHRRFALLHQSADWHGPAEGFGVAAAILLGDLCLSWSDQLLHEGVDSTDDPTRLVDVRRVFYQMRAEVIAGQYLDMHSQATADTTVERAITVARFKSAKYTVEHPLLLGAALAAAPPEIVTAYSRYGLPLGEAFQLRDDVLGVFGDPRHTGKPAGDDLREGKRTYLVASALSTADQAARQQLASGLGDPQLDEAGVARLREIIVDAGALARTEQRIDALVSEALAALADTPLVPEAAQTLRDLAAAATARTE